MRRLIATLAISLAVIGTCSVVAPQKALAATDCPTGSVKLTPAQSPSDFSASPNAAYACSFTAQDGVSQGITSLTFFDANGTQLQSGTTIAGGSYQQTNEQGQVQPVKCNGFVNFFSNASVCIGRSISAFIGTALITVTAWLLQIAGLIFNYLMYYTVVAFGDATNGFLTTGVLNAINLAWSAFRDISNIVIIGLFTFIAISIILGLNQFGNKKLIARVLIVAILINFSLLFTKIIIDFSNFTSYVFYQSMPSVQINPQNSGTFTQDGVAGKFIRFLGVTSVSDTFSTLKQGADNADSGWIILLHGLFGATLLLLAAIALLYGSFLLTVRAVVLVFLLITSSFAFATYLIPKLSESSYGWNAWWKALFQNAIFAPLLMALLWATLVLATALAPANGTLGGLLTDPTNTTNLSALFSYVIVLGFLVASFKISSSFASSISGFSFAAMNIARLGVAPLALGSRFLAAPILRGTLGRSAMGSAMRAEDELKEARMNAVETKDYSAAVRALEKKSKAENRAKRSFDAINSGIGQAAVKSTALPSFLSKKTTDNYAEIAKKAAASAAKEAAQVAVTKDEAHNKAKGEVEGANKDEHISLKEQHKAAEEMHNAAVALSKNAQQAAGIEKDRRDAEKQIADALKKKLTSTEEHKSGRRSAADHEREMDEQDKRIADAKDKLTGADVKARDIDLKHGVAEYKAQRDRTEKELGSFETAMKKRIEARRDEILAQSSEIAASAAEHIVEHEKPLFAKITGDDTFAKLARKATTGRIKNADAIAKHKLRKELDSEDAKPAVEKEH